VVEREKSAQRTESYITVIFGLMTQTWETNHKQHYFITGCQISNVTLFRRLMPTDSTDWSTRPVTCSCYKKNFPLGINKVFCLWWFWKRLKDRGLSPDDALSCLHLSLQALHDSRTAVPRSDAAGQEAVNNARQGKARQGSFIYIAPFIHKAIQCALQE